MISLMTVDKSPMFVYPVCRFFKIDGHECGNPGTIEGVSYFNYYTNVHQPMQGASYTSTY